MSERWQVSQGDSLLRLRDLPDDSVDAIITDPPYSSGGMFRGDRQAASSTKYVSGDTAQVYPEIVGDNRDQRAYLAWCSLWLAECLRIAKEGAVVVLFSDWRQLPTTTDAVQAGGWLWRGIAPWCKPTSRPQSGRIRQDAEFIVWGSKGSMPLDRPCPVIAGHWIESEPAIPGYWLEYAPREREHMTEKPLGVMRDLVKLCVPDGVVLDPFTGAATTGVAALLEGRRFIGIEASKEYSAIAERRLREAATGADRGSIASGQGALFGAVA